MAKTKAARREQQKRQALANKMRRQDGNLQAMYYYSTNGDMSVTKDTDATRPELIVAVNEQGECLVMPLSTQPLIEVHHQPIVLPTSDRLSYQAPNQARAQRLSSNGTMKAITNEMWQVTQQNLKKITQACKTNPALNASLNDWLSKAEAFGLA